MLAQSALRRHLTTPRLRRRWLIALGTAGMSAIPLVGTLGYEGSLVLTAPLSLLGLGVGIDAVQAVRAELALWSSPPGPERAAAGFPLTDLLAAGLRELGLLLGISAGILAVAQLWQPNCDPWTGLGFFAAGPGVSGLLGVIAGLVGGLLSTRPRRALLIAWVPPAAVPRPRPRPPLLRPRRLRARPVLRLHRRPDLRRGHPAREPLPVVSRVQPARRRRGAARPAPVART
jgi:hypothetical protein